ncbi:Rne/Rng family ribonuclease [Psychrobacter urativorans]|uniref:Ribonuclease E n=1 Tax=Psychrobacter urativorans TaxID=45610 RepID=A0A0M4U550_9GAMM|nr:Rne/Rng family ribonuclease [Psychrobacter urativorans]ALF59969.1 ribonuclease [Psychrobacter urativorans]
MKRILINATQNEEIRVALCKGNHLYDFDLENRTREQKKSNIYKGHVTRVEPSLEAVFVEYGSQRQGFLPIREISAEYLSGNPRDENIKKLIKEGDEIIVQVEKEERGNKGAALSTYVSLAGRYLVLMPNNPRGGGISRQISGKLREDMKRMLGNLDLAKGMSVIIRTAGIGKTQEDLQHDLNHLLNIWQAIQEQNQKYPSPRLVHQEAGVVTRAVRDYLRDDIAEIWIDNENAYVEAAGFIDAVMPTQADKLRKYTDYEPMFARFNIEKQIETAYQREVRLPSGGSIVIDQTEALVSIDINSAKSTKGSDVAETAYHTNLEAADEIARQLRLRDMGGLIVIDFIDMNDNKHQKEVEKRLIDATKYDRARVQFGDISKFGLMEMSRQRLRPSLEESTGYICPRCHGNGMIRDLRSLSLSIMREIEQIALKERQGEVQAEVPTDIAAFLLNEKRDSIVYLEQDSGTRITILPHAHLESPNFKLHFNRDGFAPTSYERITDTQQQEHSGLGYEVDWQTAEKERPEQQPTRQPRKAAVNTPTTNPQSGNQQNAKQNSSNQQNSPSRHNNEPTTSTRAAQNTSVQSNASQNNANQNNPAQANTQQAQPVPVDAQSTAPVAAQPQAVAWLSNLFAQAPQAQLSASVSSRDAAEAIEALVNTGAQSLGSFGQVNHQALSGAQTASISQTSQSDSSQPSDANANRQTTRQNTDSSSASNTIDTNAADDNAEDRRRRKPRKSRPAKPHQRNQRDETATTDNSNVDSSHANADSVNATDDKQADNQDKREQDKREQDNRRNNDNTRNRNNRQNNERNSSERNDPAQVDTQDSVASDEQTRSKRKPHSQRNSRGKLERGETLTAERNTKQQSSQSASQANNANKTQESTRHQNPNEVSIHVNVAPPKHKAPEVVHLSLDDSKSEKIASQAADAQVAKRDVSVAMDTINPSATDNTAQHREEKSVVKSTNESTNHAVPEVIATVSTAKDEVSSNAPEASEVSDSQKDSVSANQTTDSKPAIVEQQSSESQETIQAPVIADTSIARASTEVVEKQKTDTVNTVAVTSEAPAIDGDKTSSDKDSSVEDNNAKNSNAVLELTHEALFAKRYVTANKFGQASNDPRVVRRQQSHPQATLPVPAPEAVSQQLVAKAAAIRGTVGEFIQTTLPDAKIRLANDGIIRSFIDAITIHTQQAADMNTDVSEVDASKVEGNPSDECLFDFSNYGYQPLAVDYLTRFEAMTQAVSQFAAAQGKTAVEPRAISQRASNDPRGQHPDYQAQAVLTVTNEPAVSASQNAESETKSEDNMTQEVSDANVTEATQPEAMHADSQVDEHNVDVHDIDANALTGQIQADDISIESAQLLQVDQELQIHHEEVVTQTQPVTVEEAVTADSVKDDSQASKSKTTIASYKNMIENVAEQLLPQMGMFNLTTAKVPKARSRKPKTEHKKPTQAEKIENDDSDSDS